MSRYEVSLSSEFWFLGRKSTRNVLVSLSGQNSNSEDRCSSNALHSGRFCTFASFRRYTKQPPASFLISVTTKEKHESQRF